MRRRKHIDKQSLIGVQVTFVLGGIALLVRLGQYPAPTTGQPRRMRQCLEHEVPVAGAVAHAPQGIQGQCMGCVIREIETALEGEFAPFSVSQA